MNPRRASRRTAGGAPEMRQRRAFGEAYLQRAELNSDTTDPVERTANAGIAALRGIALTDAICLAAVGEYSSSGNHADAVELLRSIDSTAARNLQTLVGMKTATQYGVTTLSTEAATRAMRAARALAEHARRL